MASILISKQLNKKGKENKKNKKNSQKSKLADFIVFQKFYNIIVLEKIFLKIHSNDIDW